MRRFYIDPNQLDGTSVRIEGDEHHHLARVLRLKVGDPLVLCDGQGREARAILIRISNHAAEAQIESVEAIPPPTHSLTLFQGLPKNTSWEWIIQKTTELGIARIAPVLCERSVLRLNATSLRRKHGRWQRIADEASKQSERTHFPSVLEPIPWSEALQASSDLKILFWERERDRSLRTALRGMQPTGEIGLFVGPEGGFSEEEVMEAQNAGVRTVTLGPQVLRAETAAIVATALVLYELNANNGKE